MIKTKDFTCRYRGFAGKNKWFLLGLLVCQMSLLHAQGFVYADNPYCNTDVTVAMPTLTGSPTGTFDIVTRPAPGATLVSFDAMTGSFTPNGSDEGNYVIRFIYTTGMSTNPDTLFRPIIIDALPTPAPSISYSSNTICQSANDALPTVTGIQNGFFSIDPPATISVDPITGLLNLTGGTVGNSYNVRYNYSSPLGACDAFVFTTVTITATPDATFTLDSLFCNEGTNPTAVFLGGTSVFSSSPSNIINPATGLIGLSGNFGQFIITNTFTQDACTVTASKSITIDALPATAPTVVYNPTTYCISASDPVPTITLNGSMPGTFSSTVPVNSQTGQVDLASAGIGGPHEIIYTYTGSFGECIATVKPTISVVAAPVANFIYGDSIFCKGGPAVNATVSGTGNSFSSSPTGLIANPSNGGLNLMAPANAYIVTNTLTANGCTVTESKVITLEAVPTASIQYGRDKYCESAPDTIPIVTGVRGGIFSVNPNIGLLLDSITGGIRFANSLPGMYVISYDYTSPFGSCVATTTDGIEVIQAANPSFKYPSAFYCKNEPNPSALDTITNQPITNGNFRFFSNSANKRLVVDTTTGVINLAQSDVGLFTVINEKTANGCTVSFSFSITINDTIASTFAYAGSPFCQSGTDPRPVITGAPGGTFSSTSGVVFADPVTGEIDLSMSPANNHTITYLSPGGCGNTSSEIIEIQTATPVPNVSLSSNSICAGDPLPTLTIVGGNSLVWYNSQNITDIFTVPANPVASDLGFDNNTVGTQTVYVTDIFPGNCLSAFHPVTLTVNNRSRVLISAIPATANICSDDTLTILANGALTYQLKFNGTDTLPVSTTGVFKLTNLSGSPVIEVTGNPGGCPAPSNQITASVNPIPTATTVTPPPFIYGPTSARVSLNGLLNFSGNTSSVVFTAPRAITSSGNDYFFNPSDPSINSTGVDSVKVSYVLTDTSTLQCTSTGSFTIKVDPNNVLANALRYTSGKAIDNSFCNDVNTFSILIDMGGFGVNTNICDFFIESGGVNIATLPPTVYNGDTFEVRFSPATLQPGAYSFQLTSSPSGGGTCVSQGGFSFTIKAVPADPMLQAPLPSCEGAVNDVINITNYQSYLSGTEFIWFKDLNQPAIDTTGTPAYNTGATSAGVGNMIAYYARGLSQGCISDGIDSTFLTIYPITKPSAVTPDTVAFCEGVTVPLITVTTQTATSVVFDWFDTNDSLLTSTSNRIFNATNFNTIVGTGTMELKVAERTFITNNFNGCRSVDSAISITLSQTERPQSPTLLDSAVQDLCAGTKPGSFTATHNGPGAINWWADQNLNTLVFRGATIPGDSLPININQVGPDRVYVTTENNGCQSAPVFYEFNINPQPQVGFFNLDSVICSGKGDIILFGDGNSPYSNGDPGIFFTITDNSSGNTISNGITGNLLKTDSLNAGSYTVTYTFTDPNGCAGNAAKPLEVNPTPTADFNVSGGCVGDSLVLRDASKIELTGRDSIVIKAWDYFTYLDTGDVSIVDSFPNAGSIRITLESISNNGCSDIKEESIFIGSNPKADFTWSKRCEGDTTVFTGFTDKNVLRNDEKISSFFWNFDEGLGPQAIGDSVDRFSVTARNEFTPGVYNVSLTLVNTRSNATNASECRATVSHKVYIHPTVEVTPERDYFQDFEAQDHGWLAQPIFTRENSIPDWMWGVPQGSVINSAASGDTVWMTHLDTTYSPGEQSWVVSPCFDLRTVSRPMVNMDIWSHTVEGRDGAVLEVTTDDGENWKVLGSFKDGENTGINWYNQNTISAKPGEQAFGFGWSGEDPGWKNSRHKLDEFIGRPNVRFRVAFGSDENHTRAQDSLLDRQFNGFAFDNFFVGERKRTLLLEHFTNLLISSTSRDRAIIENLYQRYNNQLDILPIQYHMAFAPPGGDAINLLNEDDPEARAFQYAIPYVGRVALNGNEYYDASYFSTSSISQFKAHQTLIDKRALEDPLFSIEIDTAASGIQGGNWVMEAKITANKSPYPDEKVFVFFAILEDSVTQDGNRLNAVLRKLVPNNGGMAFFADRSWDQDSSEVIRVEWPLDSTLFNNINHLYSVIFVQEKDFNQVYQATSTKPVPRGIPFFPVNGEKELLGKEIKVFPNPTQEELYIALRQEVPSPLSWSLVDVQGKVIRRGMTSPHTEGIYRVEVKTIPAGVYLIQIKDSQGNIFRKRVVKTN